jgi:type VI secretion system protein ImpL
VKPVADVLTSRWFYTFVGTALLAALVWVYAPLLPQFEDAALRLVAILAMLLVWGGANVLLDARRRRRDAALAKGVTATSGGAAATEEAEALRQKLATALELLKKKIGKRGYLYEQPWYAIIGPPGAGKTTALLNSGLKFPLAEQVGQGAIAGVGGTRLCDWWFTEDAVLIDTAGRYTTQDSNAAVDRAGWDTFLDLLKNTRPRQPLNGLIVAFPLSDLARASAAEQRAHAAAIRQRVKELESRLGARMPVYFVLTKADLIAGFMEFFDDLDRDRRAQVWGTTFDLTRGETAAASFAGELKTLVERLNARLFERLQAERNPARRARIAMFPGQIASLEAPLTGFLEAACGGTPTDPAPLLRGVYITSGTQEGTPIDRLTGVLARGLGVDQTQSQTLRPQHGRSYFLERLLKEVIFGEAMLVARRSATARGAAVARVAAIAFSALLLVGGAALLWHARSSGEREIAAAQAQLAGYEQAAKPLPLDPVADDDLMQLVPLLDRARTLSQAAAAAAAAPQSWLMLGLSQRDKLAVSANTVYRHALDWALLPRLIWRLEAQLRGNPDRPDFLYEATRIYLMLGNAGPLDAPLVHEWMKLDWQIAYPSADNEAARASLLHHLDALLAEPLPAVQLDGELVAQARSKFGTVPIAQRVYSRIKPSRAAQRLPAWRPSDALGPAGVGLFVRASGKPLTDGIPGFLTNEGFHGVLLPLLAPAVKSVIAESWVLGQRVAFDPNGPQMQALQRDVIQLYEADFAHAWDAMLTDLNVVPLRSVPQAAQDLYIMAAPESPVRRLLVAIDRQVTLSVPATGAPAPSPAPAEAAPADSGADSEALRLQALLGARPQAAPEAALAPGHEIDVRYKPIRDLVGNGPGSPLDLVLRSLGDLQQQLAKMAATLVSSSSAPATPAGLDPSLALKAEALRQPQPLARWLEQIATAGSALRSGNPRQQLATIFDASGGPAELCAAVVNGHYPFVAAATDDAPLADFGRLFAPGGLLDGFVNTLLLPYIDMSVKPWKAKSADAASSPVTAADLAQFQRAAAIRDAFFADRGTVPSIRFDITPVSTDRVTKRVVLDLDGTTVGYSGGTPRSTQVTWPGSNPQHAVRLAFDPPAGGAIQETGPWSLLRLFRRARLREAVSGRDTLTFQVGDRQAAFDIRIQGATNPFAPATLQDFRCPSVHPG